MNNKGLFITASSLLVVIIGLIMYIALWADDAAYENALKANTGKAYKEFLTRYPDSEYRLDVQQRYDECDYHEAVNLNTEVAYKKYLENHPKSIYVDSVKSLIEDCVYQKAIASSSLSDCQQFIADYPNSPHVAAIKKKIDKMERDFYQSRINIALEKENKNDLLEYKRLFPKGKYLTQVNRKLEDLTDSDDYISAVRTDTKFAWQQYLTNHPNGNHKAQAQAKIKEYEEIEYYKNYSLANGSQPYRNYYGSNYSYDYGRVSVRVNASSYSDVVVIVHYNNANGRVAGHAYIRKGCSHTIYLLPERRYQVFFYYGKGWYPQKQMSGGVRGGFLADESFAKDDESMYLDYGQSVTYTLTQQVNGNFSTSHSNASEMF